MLAIQTNSLQAKQLQYCFRKFKDEIRRTRNRGGVIFPHGDFYNEMGIDDSEVSSADSEGRLSLEDLLNVFVRDNRGYDKKTILYCLAKIAVVTRCDAALKSFAEHEAFDANAIPSIDNATVLQNQYDSLLMLAVSKERHREEGFKLIPESSEEPQKRIVEILLSKGADPNQPQLRNEFFPGYDSIMVQAACTASPEIIALLHKAGGDVNAISKNRYSPLHVAALRNIGLLISLGANINPPERSFFSHENLFRTRSIRLLLSLGADANYKSEADSVMPLYSLLQSLSKIRGVPAKDGALWQAADPNHDVQDSFGIKPDWEYLDCCEITHDYERKINLKKRLLVFASIRLLIRHGADIHAIHADQEEAVNTPLKLANTISPKLAIGMLAEAAFTRRCEALYGKMAASIYSGDSRKGQPLPSAAGTLFDLGSQPEPE